MNEQDIVPEYIKQIADLEYDEHSERESSNIPEDHSNGPVNKAVREIAASSVTMPRVRAAECRSSSTSTRAPCLLPASTAVRCRDESAIGDIAVTVASNQLCNLEPAT